MDSNLKKDISLLLSQVRALTKAGAYDQALPRVQRAIDLLSAELQRFQNKENNPPADVIEERNEIARYLSDCYGKRAGLYRRNTQFDKALESCLLGCALEQDPKYQIVDSYNLTNTLAYALLVDPAALEAKQKELLHVAETVDKQIQQKRGDQWWAWADLALLSLFTRSPEKARNAYSKFKDLGARDEDYTSTIEVLQQCSDRLAVAAPDVAGSIATAIEFLEQAKPK